MSIAVSPAEEIHDPRKFIKYPFWTGLLLDLKGGWEVMALDGVTGAFRNLGAFRRIRKLADSQTPSEKRGQSKPAAEGRRKGQVRTLTPQFVADFQGRKTRCSDESSDFFFFATD